MVSDALSTPSRISARRLPSPDFFPTSLLVFVLAVGAFVVFVLPLFVPCPPVRGISASYLAGFNNSVAVVGAAGLSVVVLLVTLQMQRRNPIRIQQLSFERTLSWGFVSTVIICTTLLLSGLAQLVMAAQQRYLGDAGYIIEQASTWSETGRKLYSQIEFAYGPLLIVPEAWLSRLTHLSVTQAYYVVYVFEFGLGMCMLAYVLNQLPIRYRVRQAAMVLFALGAITPHLGVNYTFLRFVSPFAFFLFAGSRVKSAGQSAVLFALAIALELSISPELGFAMLLGMLVYAGVRAWHDGVIWLISGIVPAIALVALMATFGRAYMRMIAMFSQGLYNLPIGPYPHVLIFLVALTWIVPVYLGRTLAFDKPESARLLGFYFIALAMISAALSRSDALHVVFNGIGFFLLSLAAVSHLSRNARLAWVGCLALLVLWEHRVNENLFSWRTAVTVQKTVLPHTPPALRSSVIFITAITNHASVMAILKTPPKAETIPDKKTLDSIVGDSTIITPLEISPAWEAALKNSAHYSPLYRAFGVNMLDEVSEKSLTQEANTYRWMLLPTSLNLQGLQQLPKNLGPVQGVRMYFRLRNPASFQPGAIFEQNVRDNWMAVTAFGPYTLYKVRR